MMAGSKVRILLSANTGIGNLVQKTPLIDALTENFEGSEIHLLSAMHWGAEKAIENRPDISSIISISLDKSIIGRYLQIRNIAKKSQFSHIIIPFDDEMGFFNQMLLHLAYREAIFIEHAPPNISSWRTLIKLTLKKIVSKKVLYVPTLKGRHEIDLNLDLLEYMIAKPLERNHQTSLAVSSISEPITVDGRYIVCQLGARHGIPTAKIWDALNFTQLVRMIEKRLPNMKVVLLGDKAEQKLFEGHELITQSNVVSLMGKTDFGQMVSVLNEADVVIAHDSGLMHMANALSRPLIALFGPTDYTRTRPLGDNVTVLYSKNESFASMYGWHKDENEVAEKYSGGVAMNGIKVQQVFDALLSKLDGV